MAYLHRPQVKDRATIIKWMEDKKSGVCLMIDKLAQLRVEQIS